jgi:hypothetical protein
MHTIKTKRPWAFPAVFKKGIAAEPDFIITSRNHQMAVIKVWGKIPGFLNTAGARI